jgi:hypothetical protein
LLEGNVAILVAGDGAAVSREGEQALEGGVLVGGGAEEDGDEEQLACVSAGVEGGQVGRGLGGEQVRAEEDGDEVRLGELGGEGGERVGAGRGEVLMPDEEGAGVGEGAEVEVEALAEGAVARGGEVTEAPGARAGALL